MKSEFATLCDLAIARGVSHSDLITEVHQVVLAEYRKRYPQSPVGIAVIVDEATGMVRLFSGEVDITPSEYAGEMNQIARQVVLAKITDNGDRHSVPVTAETVKTGSRRSYRVPGIIGKIVFFGYNGYFMLFNLSVLLSALFSDISGGGLVNTIREIGTIRLAAGLAVFVLPILTLLFVWWKRLYRTTGDLMQLFFLFEIPLGLFLYITLVIAGQVSLFVSLVLLTLIAIPFLLYLHVSQPVIGGGLRKVILPFNQLAAVLASYVTALYSFVVPVILVGLAKAIFEDVFRSTSYYPYGQTFERISDYPGKFFTFGVGLIGFGLVCGLVLIPYLLTFLLWKMAKNNQQQLEQTMGNKKAERYVLVSWAVVLVLVLITWLRWPGNRLLANLAGFPRDGDYQAQEKAAIPLVGQEEKLRDLIAQKVNYRRYFLFTRDDKSIEYAYREVFDSDTFGRVMQSSFTYLAYPLVYCESGDDQRKISDNFNYLFGYQYYQDKAKTPQATAKNVLLTSRQIKVVPENGGLLATVSFEEEYENQTYQQQEVIYEFNLPAEAAVTDLKLGPNLEFAGIIAPKGAAQRTYERELQQRRDPALLEQTGPNQYRLRVFPIPAKGDLVTLQGKRQRVAFSYVVGWDNGYALPKYTRKANVYSDGSSVITVEKDGKTVAFKGDETKVETTESVRLNLCDNQTNLIGLQTESSKAEFVFHANSSDLKPIACSPPNSWLGRLQNYKTAIVYDSSYGNKGNKLLGEVKVLVQAIDRGGLLDNTLIDVYKFNGSLSPKERLTSQDSDRVLTPVHFSKTTNFSLLSNITERYDLVLVITSKDVGFSQITNFPFAAPTRVYWVGDGELPPLNMEITSGLWQTSGGAATSVEEALRRFLLQEAVRQGVGEDVITPNKYFSIKYSNRPVVLTESVINNSTGLGKIVNKGLMQLFTGKQIREVVGDIMIMDQFNLAAKKAEVVSPYSSLIALVNEQQQNRLDYETDQYNRYQDQATTENISNPPILFDTRVRNFGLEGGLFQSKSMGSAVGIQAGGSLGSISPYGGYGGGFEGLPAVNIWRGGLFVVISGSIFGIGFVVFLLRSLRKR